MVVLLTILFDRRAMEDKRILCSILPYLAYDPSSVVKEVINTLRNCILLKEGIPLQQRVKFLSGSVLDTMAAIMRCALSS